jgi:hypothetical protein
MSTRRFAVGSALVVGAVLIYIFVKRAGESPAASPAPPPPDPAVEAILQKRGRVTLDDTIPGRPAVSVRFSGKDITDQDLRLLQPFPDLTAVYLVGTGVTDDDSNICGTCTT